MKKKPSHVHTIDLNFLNMPGSIAAYAIEHKEGIILIECGPCSTLTTLIEYIQMHRFHIKSITDVFLTHIHLDHAGAAGWLAKQGARFYVHPKGAPHLMDPSKLISSVNRIYGDKTTELWGEFLPVPEEKLTVLQDGDTVEINKITIKAIDTPGHADHHITYVIDNICFSGDIGGIRLFQSDQISLPTPPPELNLEKWRQSLYTLLDQNIDFIAPTHFGIYPNCSQHIENAIEAVDELALWLKNNMNFSISIEILAEKLTDWLQKKIVTKELDPSIFRYYEKINPISMSAAGLFRYWHKIHAQDET